MINRKNWNKKYILLISVGILATIMLVLPNNKSSCFSQAVSKNQPLTNSVNIVNGITMLNGKPFFPFGFYHVSWESTAQDLIEDMRDIAAAGFNTIHASATEVNSYEKFLNEAYSLGIYVLSEEGIGLLNMINSFKQKPAVLGWNIADDVDNGKLVPQEVLKFHQQAKLADPHHITYISGYSDKIKQFGNCADVVAMQSYPIGNGDDEISLTYDRISLARDVVKQYGKTMYANVQAFAWHKKNKNSIRVPTLDEVRNMTYQALLAGAKGIIYYTYHDKNWHLPSHQDLWVGMKTLVPEIKAISSPVLNGVLNIVDGGVEKVITGMWTQRNQALIVIVNRSYDRKPVSIPIPEIFSQIKPVFDNRPTNLVLNANRLSGILKPLDVEVYQATR
ncbi:hypothetical protein [Tychonema sp. BBK16]|uniref:hypothetical protein n=1 Tax=Tychonema sp. BBK16 TaxID=2699888 RepID=UPI001F48DF94|nr:hypothetical protein [Tychonema sp. BBK16]MCF6372670.1 hypothetical protein [Tychonema sp. BBK16]